MRMDNFIYDMLNSQFHASFESMKLNFARVIFAFEHETRYQAEG